MIETDTETARGDAMPDTILGIPLHPLVVHAVVVFVPLAAAGTVAIALVPRWRRPYGWLVVGAATIAFAAVPVATQAGKALRDSLNLGGPVLEKVQRHQDWGERMIYATGALWALLVALMLLDRSGRRGGFMVAVTVLAVIAAGVATGVVLVTGHAGSEAVWNPAG